MSYVKLSKEDWRQKYNEARKAFMRKYNLSAQQVAQALSKQDVRGMSKEQIKSMKSLFTKPMARTETLASGEKISRSATTFQKHLIEGNINPRREERLKTLQNKPYVAEGMQVGTVGKQQHLPKFKELEPLKEREYKSLKAAQSHMKQLKRKIYDPTKDERFKDSFLKAVHRSGMSSQDKYDITMKIKEMPASEIADIAMTHDEFDISYVYSEVEDTNDVRANRIRDYLGISEKHYDEGGLSAQEQGYYEGVNTKSGKYYTDKQGNITLGYDINRVYKKIHGVSKK